MRIDGHHAQRILLSPWFFASVAILVLNDFYFKSTFGNVLTGKLSDFSGLFCFPLFFAALIPARTLTIYISTALGFAIWKSPLASGLIELWNLYTPLHIGRVVDYSDLLGLAILPLSYAYAGTARSIELPSLRLRGLMTGASVVFALFAFTATQLVRHRTVYFGNEYSIELGYSELEIEPTLRSNTSIVSIKSDVRLPDSHADLRKGLNDPANSNRRIRTAKTPTPSPTVSPRYFFDIEIAERTCNSDKSKFSFVVERRDDLFHIRGIDLKFDCPEYETANNINVLDKKYIEHGRHMFERHVVDHLTRTNRND